MSENVLYVKNETTCDEELEENDDWDDTILIKAYDRAVKLAKQKIAEKVAQEEEKKNNGNYFENQGTSYDELQEPEAKHSPGDKEKWRLGMSCRTAYSVDGRLYEAIIKSIDYDNGTCTVKYIGYGNTEEVELSQLLPSAGREAQKAQQKLVDDYERKKKATQQHRGELQNGESYPKVLPPPIPPCLLNNFPKDETEALTAMLMSWYMSGYHTGFYQGFNHGKKSNQQ